MRHEITSRDKNCPHGNFRVKYQESSIGTETLPIFSPLQISESLYGSTICQTQVIELSKSKLNSKDLESINILTIKQ